MKRILATLFVLITMSSNPAQAAWIDDYFNSAMTTSPSAAQSQQRGYYTAGGFTARVPHKKEPLMTMSLPTIQTGCGGIDMFWGGISFMNADYLVQKAKGVLQNAPYVLFSIGLKALSTQFGDTIEAVQAITDQLNQLQLDECAAAKGLINLPIPGIDSTSGIVGEWDRLKTNAIKAGKGISKTWNKSANQTNNDPQGEKKKAMDGNIKDAKAREFLTGTGYVLDKLASSGWEYLTNDEAKMIRALVGDVYYDNSGKESKYSYKPGCAKEIKFDDYLNDPTPTQTSVVLAAGGECGNSGISIMQRTYSSLERVYEGYTDDSARQVPFDPATLDFISRSEIPVMAYFATASSAGDVYLRATMNFITKAVGAGYAYGSLRNISATVSKVTNSLRNHMVNQEYSMGFVTAMNEYNNAIRERMKSFEDEYGLILTNLNTTFELTQKSEVVANEIEKAKMKSILFNTKR